MSYEQWILIKWACALEWQADLFVAADKRQLAAANSVGLQTEFTREQTTDLTAWEIAVVKNTNDKYSNQSCIAINPQVSLYISSISYHNMSTDMFRERSLSFQNIALILMI